MRSRKLTKSCSELFFKLINKWQPEKFEKCGPCYLQSELSVKVYSPNTGLKSKVGGQKMSVLKGKTTLQCVKKVWQNHAPSLPTTGQTCINQKKPKNHDHATCSKSGRIRYNRLHLTVMEGRGLENECYGILLNFEMSWQWFATPCSEPCYKLIIMCQQKNPKNCDHATCRQSCRI